MKPTKGRIVFYVDQHDVVTPAMITHVNERGDLGDTVELTLFSVGQTHYKTNVSYSEVPKRKHWSWPPRV